MDFESIAHPALVRMIQCIEPLVLVVDLDGRIRDRAGSAVRGLPETLASASSLAGVLATPVCGAWLGLVRDALARREGLCTIAVLDGCGHAMLVLPDESRAGSAILTLLPASVRIRHAAEHGDLRPATLLHHDWGRLDCLSRGQLDTLRSVTLGLGNDQIAERVYRTKRAIEWHIRFLNQLLGARRREDLAAIGRQAGLAAFEDSAWLQVLRARPARRDGASPTAMPEPEPLSNARDEMKTPEAEASGVESADRIPLNYGHGP